jgi:hypothetical protein
MMGILGKDIAAAVFTDRDLADEAWGLLVDADIPATIVTDPGILGSYSVQVMVDRGDLEAAQAVLAPLVRRGR